MGLVDFSRQTREWIDRFNEICEMHRVSDSIEAIDAVRHGKINKPHGAGGEFSSLVQFGGPWVGCRLSQTPVFPARPSGRLPGARTSQPALGTLTLPDDRQPANLLV